MATLVDIPDQWWSGFIAVALFAVLIFCARQMLPLWLARAPLRAGDYQTALRRLGILKRLRLRSPNLLHMTGTVLMFAGQDREAEEVLRHCLSQRLTPPQRGLYLVNLGYVLLGQKRYDEARQAYEEAIRCRPKGAVAYSSLAEVYLQQGIQPERALQLLDQGIRLKEASEQQARIDPHIFGYLFANRAWALFLLDRADEADAALEQAQRYTTVASRPGAAGVHCHIAQALAAGNRESEAMEHFRQACQIEPQGRYAALAGAALLRS